MIFYEIDNALQEAITAANKPVRIKIEFDVAGHFESVFEQDIIEANFYGLKEAAGGTTARGELLIDNPQGIYSCFSLGSGTKVKVSFFPGRKGCHIFSVSFFILTIGGIQDVRGPGRKRCALIGLRDLSAELRKNDESRDWTAPAVYAYSVVCDIIPAAKVL